MQNYMKTCCFRTYVPIFKGIQKIHTYIYLNMLNKTCETVMIWWHFGNFTVSDFTKTPIFKCLVLVALIIIITIVNTTASMMTTNNSILKHQIFTMYKFYVVRRIQGGLLKQESIVDAKYKPAKTVTSLSLRHIIQNNSTRDRNKLYSLHLTF